TSSVMVVSVRPSAGDGHVDRTSVRLPLSRKGRPSAFDPAVELAVPDHGTQHGPGSRLGDRGDEGPIAVEGDRVPALDDASWRERLEAAGGRPEPGTSRQDR